MQNVFVSIFEVESEAYQALTELKNAPADDASIVSQAVLVKKQDGQFTVLDSFDTGVETADDTFRGGLLGMCLGIIGGPVGMLLGLSYGSIVGLTVDALDSTENASLIEQIAGKLGDDTAIIGLSYEEDESILDAKLAKYKTLTARFDAAVVAQEVDRAIEVQEEMQHLARVELRKQKTDELKEKVEEKRTKMKADLEKIKTKLNQKIVLEGNE